MSINNLSHAAVFLAFVFLVYAIYAEYKKEIKPQIEAAFSDWMQSMNAVSAYRDESEIIVFNAQKQRVAVFEYEDDELIAIVSSSKPASNFLHKNLTVEIILEYFKPTLKKPAQIKFQKPQSRDSEKLKSAGSCKGTQCKCGQHKN